MEFLVLLFCLSILMGLAASFIAKKLQREPIPWFCAGFFFGLLGILLLLILPRKDRKLKPLKLAPITTLPEVPPSKEAAFKNVLWFYLDQAHERMGPYNFSGLLQAWTDGKLSVKSYVWQEEMANWEKIISLPELKSLLEREELLT